MKYLVTIPCTLGVCVEVEAADEEAAKEAAMNVDFRIEVKSDDKEAAPDIVAFETHERICYGNVYCGSVNEMEVQEL